jgi:hypothetical protein
MLATHVVGRVVHMLPLTRSALYCELLPKMGAAYTCASADMRMIPDGETAYLKQLEGLLIVCL